MSAGPAHSPTIERAPRAAFPGPKSALMLEEMQKYVIADLFPFVVDLERSKGMYLATVDGQMLFDWAGYFGAKLIGHNHPGLYEEDYVRRLIIAANNKIANPDFLSLECLAYYRKLHEIAPVCMRSDKLEVYVINSGAEAIENLMKYLLIKHEEKHGSCGGLMGKRRFIYFDRAFHGRTVYALNVTQPLHDPLITNGFNGVAPGNIRVPFPSADNSQPEEWNSRRSAESLALIEEHLKEHGNEIVGIIVEPIQGAGGQRIARKEFFQRLSDLTHRYGVYLAFDEIQTAGGQLGTIFACDQLDLPHPPQAVAVGKKFANGAVYMLDPMMTEGVLDSTWGGTLADMVRFVQEMAIVEREHLIVQVPEKERVLKGGLEALTDKYPDLMFNVRGMGLYQGFTLRSKALRVEVQRAAREDESLLLLGGGMQTIRFRPALDVSIDEIKLMLTKLDRVLAKLKPNSGQVENS